MIVTEIKNARSTVRIHDEFCKAVSKDCVLQLNRIVSDSYKRRMLLTHEKGEHVNGEVPKSL